MEAPDNPLTLETLSQRAGSEFLFHYTDSASADFIIEDRLFVVGTGMSHGAGIYATQIAPVDGQTIEDVITHCFNGVATPAEVNHAIAIRVWVGGEAFEQLPNGYEWILPTGMLECVHLEGFYVAAAAWSGRSWQLIDTEA